MVKVIERTSDYFCASVRDILESPREYLSYASDSLSEDIGNNYDWVGAAVAGLSLNGATCPANDFANLVIGVSGFAAAAFGSRLGGGRDSRNTLAGISAFSFSFGQSADAPFYGKLVADYVAGWCAVGSIFENVFRKS